MKSPDRTGETATPISRRVFREETFYKIPRWISAGIIQKALIYNLLLNAE